MKMPGECGVALVMLAVPDTLHISKCSQEINKEAGLVVLSKGLSKQ